MTADELRVAVEKHGEWLRGEKYGQRADLQRANLQDADLQRANLQDANLQDADLRDANLQRADLQGANLQRADLQRADLRDANLQGAKLPHFQISQHGELRAYKKAAGKIVLLKIPSWAKRTGSLIGRKCRASAVVVLAIQDDNPVSTEHRATYEIGKTILPDNYDPDPRVECSHGIHFFLTRAEAEEWK